jgi:hypothetical protein
MRKARIPPNRFMKDSSIGAEKQVADAIDKLDVSQHSRGKTVIHFALASFLGNNHTNPYRHSVHLKRLDSYDGRL